MTTTTTQSRTALMRRKKPELVDEVMALHKQLSELETAKDGPSVTGASNEIAIALLDAVEHLRDGIVIYDAKGRFVHCNENYRKTWNYTEEDTTPGVHYDDLVQLDTERGTILNDRLGGHVYSELRFKQRVGLKDVLRFQVADGRWIETRDWPSPTGGTVNIQIDITERKKAEEQLQAANTHLAQFSEAVSEYLDPMLVGNLRDGGDVEPRIQFVTVFLPI